jgi:NAD dependent epimerase/dehydratase family enzyme
LLRQRDFMQVLRNGRFGLLATRLMAEVGAFVLRSDTELLLKSRRVVPDRLLAEGFVFEHPTWPEAAADLRHRRRTGEGMHAAVVGVDP